MLGDWDLQSTLLRRAIQEGALRCRSAEGERAAAGRERGRSRRFSAQAAVASRGARTDWVSRYVLPPVEEFATERLMETAVRPIWLIWAALALTLGGAFCFTRGWLGAGLGLLLLSTPLDIVASRLATLRLRPLAARLMSRLALWPAGGRRRAGARLVGGAPRDRLGRAGHRACAASAFAEAARIEKAASRSDGDLWLFSRRSAILPRSRSRSAGAWTGYLVALLVYAAAVFFHRPACAPFDRELTGS